MNLTKNFTLAEFTHSQTAARRSIDNDPPAHILPKLATTAAGMELVRELLGKPITISSGYRGPDLNAAVKGSKHSQHLTGEACDFICPAYGIPKLIVATIMASDVPFDQLILEFSSWIHISFSLRNRREVLVIDSTGVREFA